MAYDEPKADEYTDATTGQGEAAGTAAEAIADITSYEKEYQKWWQRGKAILDRYRDQRAEATNLRVVSRKFNILWANTETLKPTLYARLPRIQVERRFKDSDPIGRVACEIAERAGNYLLETSPFDNVLRLCVQDRLLPGRATSWVNYKADLTEVTQPFDSEDMGEDTDEEEEPELEKIREVVEPIYVDWRDFGHSPKRTWQEVTRAWRICYMTRTQLVERFGKELGQQIALDHKKDDPNSGSKSEASPDNLQDTASIYEVWDKAKRKVCWVSKTQPDYLDEIDPPVDLEDFWPFPRPLWATLTNDTLIPVPDYALYQDQAAELDKLTNRIGRFTDALKIGGVYDASIPELQRILMPNGTPDNTLVPVANWNNLAEKGGLAGSVILLPMQEIAATLLQLYTARDQVLSVIYQVTGIADVIRGASNPNETATAQSIKGQFASLRIQDTQAEVARFARDTARIMVEMAVEMYEPDTLYQMVQADQFCEYTPRELQQNQVAQQYGQQPGKPTEQFAKALMMLRDDKLRSFHVEIETDSTIALNEQEDKQSVTEFLGALGSFMQSFGPIAQQMPQLTPVIGEALLYASRRFKAGRSLESAIEKAVGQIVQMANQPKGPSPEQIKAQSDQQNTQAKLQNEQQKNMGQLQIKAQKDQGELALKQRDQQARLVMDANQQQFEHAMDIRDAENREQLAKRDNVVELIRG